MVIATFVTHPGRSGAEADSWSVPVDPAVGWVRVHVAVPLDVLFVDDAPEAPPSRLPVVPACASVTLRPLSLVTVRPFAS